MGEVLMDPTMHLLGLGGWDQKGQRALRVLVGTQVGGLGPTVYAGLQGIVAILGLLGSRMLARARTAGVLGVGPNMQAGGPVWAAQAPSYSWGMTLLVVGWVQYTRVWWGCAGWPWVSL